jgi:hippurate hydrolase
MCGHDGHITCLVGFVPKFILKKYEIPNDKVIRLLFQPSSEGP